MLDKTNIICYDVVMDKTQITLKKVRVFASLSEETTCYQADVYIDGVLVGQAENTGKGGCTFIQAYGKGDRALLAKAVQAFAKANFDGFAGVVDEILEAQNNAKRYAKDFAKGICFGVPNGMEYKVRQFRGRDGLAKIAGSPNGLVAIQKLYNDVKANLGTGEVVLNDNLESLGVVL